MVPNLTVHLVGVMSNVMEQIKRLVVTVDPPGAVRVTEMGE